MLNRSLPIWKCRIRHFRHSDPSDKISAMIWKFPTQEDGGPASELNTGLIKHTRVFHVSMPFVANHHAKAVFFPPPFRTNITLHDESDGCPGEY
ncbi:hypothetical protein VTG60DRAFT_4824 [Thermothelomyces hinnuleus]